jgi:hypothetical protein
VSRERGALTRAAEWERLLLTVRQNQEEMPHLLGECDELEAGLSNLRELQVRRRELAAERLRSTQETQTLLKCLVDLVRRIRHGVRGVYSIGDPKLTAFGITPYAGRRRKEVRWEPGLEEAESSPKLGFEG